MTSAVDCLVIGSGTTGVACASALIAAGRSVLMIDPGVTLEPERADMLARAHAQGPLSPTNAPWLRGETPQAGIPRKLIYGSDFPFREASEQLHLEPHDMGAEPSFARGGLSNVWGAAVLPFAAHDTADWPVSEGELAPHYKACADMLGFAGEEDDLAEWLPLYGRPHGQLRASPQATTMLDTLSRHRDALRAAGVRFGRARVAARANECVYCGLCLHGCPEHAIYSASDTLARLQTNPQFSYQSGAVIETVSETGDSARAIGIDRTTKSPLAFEARQIFIAAGALPTSAMLLRSKGAYDKSVRVKDSQYFLLPLALFSGTPKARESKLHTMGQLFLELRDAAISPYTIHLQVYTYNSLMAQTMRARLHGLEPVARWGDAHFVLIQGYLHSDHSGEIELTLRRDKLDAVGIPNPEAKLKITAVVRKLAQLALQIGAVPLPPLMQIAEPGRGFHIGGSFPMKRKPGAFETDTLGRPVGWSRIHAVDATILPSIPATTITYPVMANAHRIATQAARAIP